MRSIRLIGVLAFVPAAALTGALAGLGSPAPQRFRILTPQAGVYRVSFASLADAGLPLHGVASRLVGLSAGGRPVPLAVMDDGDGHFGPGDHLEFVAAHLRGETSYHHELAAANVYWLALKEGGPRIEDVSNVALGGPAASLRLRPHLEEDRVMIRLSSRDREPGVEPEFWFWSKLTHLADPLRVPLDLTGLDAGDGGHVEVSASFRGLSERLHAWRRVPDDHPRDHLVTVALAGNELGELTWDGHRMGVFVGQPLLVSALGPGSAQLVFRVPRRPSGTPREPIIDVVMLNWIELSYPHDGVARPGQAKLWVEPSPDATAIELSVPAGSAAAVYSDTGRRVRLGPLAPRGGTLRLPRDTVAENFWLVEGPLLEPSGVELDAPTNWASAEHQADYLMIAHSRLLSATQRLADFHRSRGLAVAVADVQDLYDEFNHGIPHPRALRDFIDRARHGWRSPAPRFVLLVGDASWDPHNAVVDDALYADWVDRQLLAPGDAFRSREITPYEEGPARNDRNLVPAPVYLTPSGQAAADDWYVADDLGDLRPAIAIGRLPVAAPAELEAIVEKSIAWVGARVGPWRRQALWITNEEAVMQLFTDSAASRLATRGFVPTRVYPRPEETSNAGHQQTILDAFAAGQALVQFAGHGGRFIWRTGPPDPFKNHDLLTLDHLDTLTPSHRLPVVVSLSCHTAPFDHPSADSIGEKLLRLPDRGAVAVFAASWRSAPSLPLVEGFVGELARPGTLGEALVRAKQSIAIPDATAMYNLLGDPALPTPGPQREVALAARPAGDDGELLSARLPEGSFQGRVLVEWLDENAVSLGTEERAVEDPFLAFAVPELEGLRWASVYFWDEQSGVDALGGLDLLVSSPSSASP